jgi:ATP synthase protein I
VIILVLSGAGWLDGTAFGLAILVVALVWQVCQVVAFLRMRHSVYDDPSTVPSGADQPGSGRAAGEGR